MAPQKPTATRPSVPPRSTRTSIASYRAEATFFKTLADSETLDGIAPRAFWVHVDDRLGYGQVDRLSTSISVPHHPPRNGYGLRTGGAKSAEVQKEEEEEGAVEMLRESCFMMITGRWRQ